MLFFPSTYLTYSIFTIQSLSEKDYILKDDGTNEAVKTALNLTELIDFRFK
jgi:hypothetical protein